MHMLVDKSLAALSLHFFLCLCDRYSTTAADATPRPLRMPLHNRYRCHSTTATDATPRPLQMPMTAFHITFSSIRCLSRGGDAWVLEEFRFVPLCELPAQRCRPANGLTS